MIHLALTIAGDAIAITGIWITFRGDRQTGFGVMAAGNWILFTTAVATHSLTLAPLNGFAAVFITWMWWKGGGGGRTRRALRQLGAKSTARIRALVRSLAPSPASAVQA